MTFTMSNSQYVWSNGWSNRQTVNVSEPVYVIEKLSFVKYRQSFEDISSKYGVGKKLFIAIWT